MEPEGTQRDSGRTRRVGRDSQKGSREKRKDREEDDDGHRHR